MEYRKTVLHQRVGDEEADTEVLLPAAEEETEAEPVGFWGQKRLRYIRKHRRAFYIGLLTDGTLNAYLADIDRQADSLMESTVRAMAEADGTDEALKANDMMKWVGRMNNYRSCAREIICSRLICV